MGNLQSRATHNLLWDIRLRLSLNTRGRVIRQPGGHLGHRSAGLLDAGREGALLPHQPQVDYEEHHERTSLTMQC